MDISNKKKKKKPRPGKPRQDQPKHIQKTTTQQKNIRIQQHHPSTQSTNRPQNQSRSSPYHTIYAHIPHPSIHHQNHQGINIASITKEIQFPIPTFPSTKQIREEQQTPRNTTTHPDHQDYYYSYPAVSAAQASMPPTYHTACQPCHSRGCCEHEFAVEQDFQHRHFHSHRPNQLL